MAGDANVHFLVDITFNAKKPREWGELGFPAWGSMVSEAERGRFVIDGYGNLKSIWLSNKV